MYTQILWTLFSILLLSSLYTPNPAFAQVSTSTSSSSVSIATTTAPASLPPEASSFSAPEVILEVSSPRTDRRAPLAAATQSRIINLAANVSNRLESSVARLEQITGRFTTRLDLLAVAQRDVSLARADLETASRALMTARTALQNIDQQVADVVGSDEPTTAWAAVRSNYQAARLAIIEAHSALRNALTQVATAPDMTLLSPTTTATSASLITE